jgi:hypothetical protein
MLQALQRRTLLKASGVSGLGLLAPVTPVLLPADGSSQDLIPYPGQFQNIVQDGVHITGGSSQGVAWNMPSKDGTIDAKVTWLGGSKHVWVTYRAFDSQRGYEFHWNDTQIYFVRNTSGGQVSGAHGTISARRVFDFTLKFHGASHSVVDNATGLTILKWTDGHILGPGPKTLV